MMRHLEKFKETIQLWPHQAKYLNILPQDNLWCQFGGEVGGGGLKKN